jgi:AcrR family transcriptional regulator
MSKPDSITRSALIEAAEQVLHDVGFAGLSTRRVAEMAGVPLSQIHYHFGSKAQLMLAVLLDQNRKLLDRQVEMYGEEVPLWKRYEQACDFLEDDLASGYVRVLQEMTAAGWSDPAIAAVVRDQLEGWMRLLSDVAEQASEKLGGLGPFTPPELAWLIGLAFLGGETMILLGFRPDQVRESLRSVGRLIMEFEEGDR